MGKYLVLDKGIIMKVEVKKLSDIETQLLKDNSYLKDKVERYKVIIKAQKKIIEGYQEIEQEFIKG